MIGIRKSLDCIFTRRELKILDDIMPEMSKRAAIEDMHTLEEGDVSYCLRCLFQSNFFHFSICVQDQPPAYPGNIGDDPLASAKLLIIPTKPINITEEVNKTTIWKQVNEGNNGTSTTHSDANKTKRKHGKHSK